MRRKKIHEEQHPGSYKQTNKQTRDWLDSWQLQKQEEEEEEEGKKKRRVLPCFLHLKFQCTQTTLMKCIC
jgi:hypothetical protein